MVAPGTVRWCIRTPGHVDLHEAYFNGERVTWGEPEVAKPDPVEVCILPRWAMAGMSRV